MMLINFKVKKKSHRDINEIFFAVNRKQYKNTPTLVKKLNIFLFQKTETY